MAIRNRVDIRENIGAPWPKPSVDGTSVGNAIADETPSDDPTPVRAPHDAGPVWRTHALGIGAVVLLGVLVVASRSDIPSALDAIRSSDARYLIGGFLLALVGLTNQAGFHAAAQRAAGGQAGAAELLRPAAAAGLLNTFVKSGAMAGLAPMVGAARRNNRSRASTVAGYLLVNILGHLAFAATLAAGLLALVIDGRFTKIDGVAAAVFLVFSSVQLSLIALATRSRRLLQSVYSLPGAVRRFLPARFRVGGSDRDATDASAGELYDSVSLLRNNPRAALPAFGHSLIVEVVGIAELWCVLRALGVNTVVTVPLVAYSVSVLFTIVGFLPGGLGFVEAGLGAVLASFTVPSGKVVAAVILYRVLELWIPAIFGVLALRSITNAVAP